MTRVTVRIAAAALLAVALVVTLSAQQARDQARIALAGTATVTGTVVLDDEKRPPLRRATVTLARQGIEDIRTTATDDAGRYVFTDLPSGTYILAAAKGGHLAISHGAPKPGMPGQAIFLRDGQSLDLSPVAVPRGAVIAGRVVDRFGQPVPNLGVQASQFLTINGERRRRVVTGGSGTAVTNQHGDYRIFGLGAGSYVVFATPPSGVRGVEMIDTPAEAIAQAKRPEGTPVPLPAPLMYVPTLYPGVGDSAVAAAVELGKGQERTDVDFALLHVAVGQLRGTVLGPDGSPLAGVSVSRWPSQSGGFLPTEGPGFVTDANGRFTMRNVAPATYIVHAIGAPPSSRQTQLAAVGLASPTPSAATGTTVTVHLHAMAAVTMAPGATLDVTLQMQPSPALSGSVALRGSSKAAGVNVRLIPATANGPGRSGSATIDADLKFRVEGLIPGSYRLGVFGTAPGTRAVSARAGDVDLLDIPFDLRSGAESPPIVITLTDVPTSISGRLIDAAGAPVSSLYVMAFSANPSHWFSGSRRIGAMRAGPDGSYLFDTLPAGDYYVCALTELDATLQYEGAFLQELIPASARITLGDGQTIRQDLRIGGW